MRILHCIPSVDAAGGGPIESIFRLHAVSRPWGVEHEIVSLDHRDDPWVSAAPIPIYALGDRRLNAEWWRAPANRYRYTAGYVDWLAQNLSRYDTVIVHGLWTYSSSGASQVLPKVKTPYFLMPHGMMDPWFGKRYPHKHVVKQLLWFVAEGRLASKARSLLFTAETERALAGQAFLGHRYREKVIKFGTAMPPAEAENERLVLEQLIPGLGPSPFIVFLGRIHEKKGCDILIEAFARAIPADNPLKLVIAGPSGGNLQGELQRLAAQLGLADRVFFPGPLFDTMKWAALRQAEAFALPSHQENFGIAVAEALGCGTPVLISNRVNIYREIQDSGGGLVANDNISDFTDLLRQWLQLSPQEKMEFRHRALNTFKTHFDIEITGHQFIDYLRHEVTASKAQRS
ncbi:glycosyltransferase [Sphingomonas sp. GlSt437]|uniref:glycosyltransferase n=2 Tax=Bacteria TaxID=2 RepID=UPI003A88498E